MPFDCVLVGEAWLLRDNPAVACYDEDWLVLAALGAFGTVFYSLGIPLAFGLVTRAAHRRTERAGGSAGGASLGEKSVGGGEKSVAGGAASGATDVTAQRRQARAQLLVRSYRRGFWYWESVELLRKYLLTSVVLVAFHSTLVQVYLGLFVCVAFMLSLIHI